MNQKPLPHLISPPSPSAIFFGSSYLHARFAWMTYTNARRLRCLNAIWVIILWLLCSVPARSLCKKGWENSGYHPLPGGYICWLSTLKANSNKLLLEATLHHNLCDPPRCMCAVGANRCVCCLPDTINPAGTFQLTVTHNWNSTKVCRWVWLT